MKVTAARSAVAPLLLDGEEVQAGFALIRDRLVFTDRRIIFMDVQGITGKKVSYRSVPYKNVNSFSVETAGSFDLDAELKVWVKGQHEPLSQDLSKQIDTSKVSRLLAAHVLSGSHGWQTKAAPAGKEEPGQMENGIWKCRCGAANEDAQGNYCNTCGRSREAVI